MKQWKEGRWQQVGTRMKKPGDGNEEGAMGAGGHFSLCHCRRPKAPEF